MTNKQVAVIVAAILVASLLIVLGPSTLTSMQRERDNDIACISYQASVWQDNLNSSMGKRVDREATERKRIAGGCTPVD